MEAVVHAGPSIPIEHLPGNPQSLDQGRAPCSLEQPRSPSTEVAYPESIVWLHSSLQVRDHIDNLYLVSDGRVKGGKGSYGWVIASDSVITVKAHGRATGYPTTSFHAENLCKMGRSKMAPSALARWNSSVDIAHIASEVLHRQQVPAQT